MNTSAPRQARLGPDGQWQLDVRGLQPPQPFVAILRALEGRASDGRPILVSLDRDPLPLYPELAQRGWAAERVEGEPSEVRLRLTRCV